MRARRSPATWTSKPSSIVSPRNKSAGASAGYSGTPLTTKLGVKAGSRIALISAPTKFFSLLRPVPADVRLVRRLSRDASVTIAFVRSNADLERGFSAWKRSLAKDASLWICWRKQASDKATDVGERSIRDYVLAHGLVDVKICAIDQTWSGMKFVYRLKDR